jgi:hypothetical protein
VPVVIVIAIVVILAAVVLVAAGRGGEMPATERSDYAPLDLGPVSATDVVLLRPPTALWGYNQQATDEALDRIAESIRERDVRIVALEQLVTDLSRQPGAPVPLGSPYEGARHARPDDWADWTVPVRESPGTTVPPGSTVPIGSTGPLEPALPSDPTVPIDHGPSMSDTAVDPLDPVDPLGAPVEDPEEQGGSMPPWESGTGWPPEVSHD